MNRRERLWRLYDVGQKLSRFKCDPVSVSCSQGRLQVIRRSSVLAFSRMVVNLWWSRHQVVDAWRARDMVCWTVMSSVWSAWISKWPYWVSDCTVDGIGSCGACGDEEWSADESRWKFFALGTRARTECEAKVRKLEHSMCYRIMCGCDAQAFQ